MNRYFSKKFLVSAIVGMLMTANFAFAAIAQDCDDYLDMAIATPVADMVDPGSNGLPREILILRADQTDH